MPIPRSLVSARAGLILSLLMPLACSDSDPDTRPQIVFRLDVDAELRARATWVRVRVNEDSGAEVFSETIDAAILPQDYPLVARNNDTSRQVRFQAEVFESTARPDTDATVQPIGILSGQASYAAERVGYVPLLFTAQCSNRDGGGVECPDGQTCVQGACVGECFSLQELTPELAPAEPTCNACQACGAAQCADRADASPCQCPNARCEGGRCRASPVTSLAAGLESSCAVRNAELLCWGSNESNALGTMTGTQSLEPISILTGVLDVDYGGDESSAQTHGCASLTAGGVSCWGSNAFGQLGLSDVEDRMVPTELATVFDGAVVRVESGGRHTCVLDNGGSVWCWGANDFGQLGTGAGLDQDPSPARLTLPSGVTGSQLCTGLDFGCAVGDDGNVYCWGDNSSLQLGAPGANESVPAVVELEGAGAIRDVTCGDRHVCALTQADDRAWCWGANDFGGLGRPTTDFAPGPPAAIGGSFAFRELSCGSAHCCGIETQTGLQCWGWDNRFQLGVSDTLDPGALAERSQFRAEALRPLGRGRLWSELALGRQHSCAVHDDDFVWCWGSNDSGQLGNGTTEGRSSPSLLCLP
ncbi:MAG: hypothetical protein AAF219_07255 [Myxococcota bacterium]